MKLGADFLRVAMTAAGAAAAPVVSEAQAQRAEHQAVPSDPTLRVKSLESLLVEKGLVDRKALDALIDTYEHKVGPAQRCARGGAGLGRSRIQAAPADRRRRRARGARVRRPAGRTHGGGREHRQGAQPCRLHAVLLLSLAGARTAAGLVQVRPVSLPLGDRSARRSARIRARTVSRTSKCACGTARRSCVTWSCPSGRLAPRS